MLKWLLFAGGILCIFNKTSLEVRLFTAGGLFAVFFGLCFMDEFSKIIAKKFNK